jgi:hypothetical protein
MRKKNILEGGYFFEENSYRKSNTVDDYDNQVLLTG